MTDSSNGNVRASKALVGLFAECDLHRERTDALSTGRARYDASMGWWYLEFECPTHGRFYRYTPEASQSAHKVFGTKAGILCWFNSLIGR